MLYFRAGLPYPWSVQGLDENTAILNERSAVPYTGIPSAQGRQEVVVENHDHLNIEDVRPEDIFREAILLATSRVDNYIITNGQVTLAPNAPKDAMAAVQSIKKTTKVLPSGATLYQIELRLWDKPSILRLVGRQLGLFVERLEHTGVGGGPIETVSRVERVIVDGTNGPNSDSPRIPTITDAE